MTRPRITKTLWLSAALTAYCALAVGHASAQGVFFDVGSGLPTRVHCSTDSASWLEFPAYPFGDSWPLGSIVYAELGQEPHATLGTLHRISFSDQSCGCGTELHRPVTYRFHYDESLITWPEESSVLYSRQGGGWVTVTGAVLDPESNTFSGMHTKPLLGSPTYVVGPPNAFDDDKVTWGKIKSMYQ